ncbi:MAG: GntR family transcriptional regulator, partial [Alicyclobacillus sp.]|nr:GntR family transcriptional regulator [Alicyclobacillus sp.]
MDSPVVPSTNALRRDIPLALHYQLKMLIKAKIENGEWPPGAKILSEKDLADQHGVSRLTARQAVQELVRDGWLYRESGRGTFVADYRIQQRLSRLTSFTEDLLERNMIPGARVVSTRLTGPTEAVGSTLQLARDVLLFEIVRVRLANKSPIAYEKIYIPQSLAPDIAAQDLTSSITSLLESRYGLKCPYAEQRIRAD